MIYTYSLHTLKIWNFYFKDAFQMHLLLVIFRRTWQLSSWPFRHIRSSRSSDGLLENVVPTHLNSAGEGGPGWRNLDPRGSESQRFQGLPNFSVDRENCKSM